MQDHLLFIGISSHNLNVASAGYLSDYNFAERRLILWDPLSLVREFRSQKIDVEARLNVDQLSNATFQLLKRNSIMTEFLSHGGDLIVILRDLNFPTLDVNSYTALQDINPFSATGVSVAAQGSGELLLCLDELNADLTYTATSTTDNFIPLLIVPNSKEIVGGFKKTEAGGYIVFLPPPKTWMSGNSQQFGSNSSFIEATLRIPSLLREQEGVVTDLPVWAERFQLPKEKASRLRIREYEKVVNDVHARIAEERQTITSFDINKQLFSGFGDSLEEAVLESFKVIGMQAVKGVEGEADILARIDETVLAIEVKGLTGVCKRKNATQCKNWVVHCESVLRSETSELDVTQVKYADKLREIGVPVPTSDEDRQCDWAVKGLLVINTHRNKPLDERDDPSEPSFLDSVVAELKRSGSCAMTGLQLLGLSLAVAGSEEEGPSLLKAVIDTDGVYEPFLDWRDFLHLSGPIED